MIRLLHLEITDTCEGCPYFFIQSGIGIRWAYCQARSGREIFEKNRKLDRNTNYPLIPKWCPLPEYIEGGKF